MIGNKQKQPSFALPKPPRNLVYYNKNNARRSENVGAKEQVKDIKNNIEQPGNSNETPAIELNQSKINRAKRRRQRKKENTMKTLQEMKLQQINGAADDLGNSALPDNLVETNPTVNSRKRRKFVKKAKSKQNEDNSKSPTREPTEPSLVPKNAESTDVDNVCQTMEDLHIQLTKDKGTIKPKKRTRNEKPKKPTNHKYPPQMKDISSEDVFCLSTPNRTIVPQPVVDLYRQCALREEKKETQVKPMSWPYDAPLNFLKQAVHVHPSEAKEPVIGMIVKNDLQEVIIRLEGPLHELENELRYLLLTKDDSTAAVNFLDGSVKEILIPLNLLLIGSRIVIHEVGTQPREKDQQPKTPAELFHEPLFHVKSFSPYAMLHEEIGLCVFSRREISKNSKGDTLKWLEMELLGPSFRKPFRCNNISCYVKDWEDESWNNWGHNFVNCTMWRLPFCKTQCFKEDIIVTVADQDPETLNKFSKEVHLQLNSNSDDSKDFFNKTALSLIGVRLTTDNEFNLIQENYKIPLNNVRHQELYIRDAYLSLSLLEEHVYSGEIRKMTVNLPVFGLTYHDKQDNRTIGRMQVKLNRDQYKRLFMESSTASWDKSQRLMITVMEWSEMTLYGYILREPHSEVGYNFEVELEPKSVESWARLIENNPNPEVTIGPIKRKQDSTSDRLYKKFASLRHSEIHNKWLKCEGYITNAEEEQIHEQTSLSIRLDGSQQAAFKYAIERHGFSCITAATGTGKTLVTVAIVKELLALNQKTTYKPILVCAQNNSGIDRIEENFKNLLPEASVIRLISSTRDQEYPCDIGMDRMCRRMEKYLKCKDHSDWKYICGKREALKHPTLQKALEDVNVRMILCDPQLFSIFSDHYTSKTFNNNTMEKVLANEDVLDVLRDPEVAKTLLDLVLRPVLADWDLMKALDDQKIQSMSSIPAVSAAIFELTKIREDLLNQELSSSQIEKLWKKEEKAEMELKTVVLKVFKPEVIIGTVDMLARHNFESETVIVEEGGQFSSSSMLTVLECMRQLKQIILVGDPKLIGPFNVFRFDSQAQLLRGLSEMERITRGSGTPSITLNYSYRAAPKLVSLQKLRYPEIMSIQPRQLLYGNIGIPKSGKGDPFAFVSYPLRLPLKGMKDQYRVDIVKMILRKLFAQKVKPEDIVVLSYLRVHCRGLHEDLKSTGVEVCTVDSFQGRESPIVIVLAALTQNEHFSDDIRRLTVAISRAREYLYIIGPQPLFQLPSWEPYSEYAQSNEAFLSSMDLSSCRF